MTTPAQLRKHSALLVAIAFMNCLPCPAQDAAQIGSQPPELAAARAEYEGRLAVPRGKLEAAIKARAARYAGELKTLEDRAAAAGQLDAVVAVKAEREAYEKGGTTSGFAAGDLKVPASARQLRAAFDGDVARLRAAAAPEGRVLAQAYVQQLGNLERRLTSQKSIDAALAVRREKEATQQEGMAPLDPGNPPPSALRTQLLGTTWKWWRSETVTFMAGGKGRWSESSKDMFTWKVKDGAPRSIEGTTPHNEKYTITFDPSLTSGTIGEGTDKARQIQLLKGK